MRGGDEAVIVDGVAAGDGGVGGGAGERAAVKDAGGGGQRAVQVPGGIGRDDDAFEVFELGEIGFAFGGAGAQGEDAVEVDFEA